MKNCIYVIFGSALALFVASCASVGTGSDTIVLWDPPKPPTEKQPAAPAPAWPFDHLIATHDRKVIGLRGKRPATIEQWNKFKKQQYGTTKPTADLSINARDRTATPPLNYLDIEVVDRSSVAKILSNEKTSIAQKSSLLTQLRDTYRFRPDIFSRSVMNKYSGRQFVMDYFPHIEIDFTGSVRRFDANDRFEYLAAAIRLPADQPVKFINVSPKAPDLFQFSLGQLKQTSSLQAAAQAGETGSATTTDGSTDTTTNDDDSTVSSSGSESISGDNLGLALTGSVSEEFVNDLKNSLAARSVGIYENGKLLLIELRGNELRRIAGTYSFDVMLQITSELTCANPQSCQEATLSEPLVPKVTADTRLVGVVRHVEGAGKTGWVNRVPEPSNDDTFHVVEFTDAPLDMWTFTAPPFSKAVAPIAKDIHLTVYANEKDATYYIVDANNGSTIAAGSGLETKFTLPAPTQPFEVIFADINRTGEKPSLLKAAKSGRIALSTSPNGSIQPAKVFGAYSIQ